MGITHATGFIVCNLPRRWAIVEVSIFMAPTKPISVPIGPMQELKGETSVRVGVVGLAWIPACMENN